MPKQDGIAAPSGQQIGAPSGTITSGSVATLRQTTLEQPGARFGPLITISHVTAYTDTALGHDL